MNRIELDSPLRKPPAEISERQIVILDGIRYSADMAAIALERLWAKLCAIDQDKDTSPTPWATAEAMLDAWSIIDAAHRLIDLIRSLPGLPNAPWQRVFQQRMEDAIALRNVWQHQDREAPRVVEQRGQIWGALAWMQHDGPKPTGHWFLAVGGTEFKGSNWTFAGPANAIPREDSRRVRLLHGERTVYLARMVGDIFEAIRSLENDLRAGALRLIGEQVNRPRESDSVMSATITVLYGTVPVTAATGTDETAAAPMSKG